MSPVLWYAATHPLRFDAQHTYAGLQPRTRREPSIHVRIVGLGSTAVTDLAVVRSEGSPGLQLDRAGVVANRWNAGERRPLRPLEELPPGSFPDRATLELRQGRRVRAFGARSTPSGSGYTVLGMRHEQRIPLVDGPSVRCR